jgi:predicted amidohydrolase
MTPSVTFPLSTALPVLLLYYVIQMDVKTRLDARVGLAQLVLPTGELAANRERLLDAIHRCADQGADLVVLPELASSGYRMAGWREALAVAEPIPGPTTEGWREAAAATGCYVVGGICERDGGALYNSVAVVGPEGVLARYRKLHLFAEERLVFQPGDAGLPIVTLPFGRVGVVVCYDLRFPEAMRILALRGADLIAVPTAWAPGFDRTPPPDGIIDQVHAAAVQANLNQVWVVCASRSGADGDLAYLGSSVIVNPHGRIEYGPAPRDEEVLEVASIDLAEARRAKVRDPLITPLADRRTDVYDATLGYRGDPPQAHPPARPVYDGVTPLQPESGAPQERSRPALG